MPFYTLNHHIDNPPSQPPTPVSSSVGALQPNLLEYINTTMAWTADQVAANVANFSEPSSSFEWQYWAQVSGVRRRVRCARLRV